MSLHQVEDGVEWIGEIPPNWKLRKFRYSVSIPNGQVDPRLPEYRDLPLIAPNHIESNTGRILDYSSADDQGAESGKYRFKKGEVLYSKIRPELAKACLAPVDGLCSADMYPLHPAKGMAASYLSYLLISSRFTQHIILASSRVAMPKVNRDELGDCHIPVPSLDEQQAIGNFLDRKTAQIDALLAQKRRQIELLGEKRQALISQAVTKGLDATAPTKDSGIPWLGKIPAHWKPMQLRRLIKPGTTITYGIVQAGPDIEGGIPYIRTSDMAGSELPRDGYLRTSAEIDQAYARSKVYTGDIVVAIRATVGKALPVPDYLDGANLTQGTAKVSPGSLVRQDFLLWALNSSNSQQGFESFAKGATFKEITLEMLRWFWVALPPLEEQAGIAAHLGCETSRIDRVIGRLTTQIGKLREYRQTLISAAVTGKIEVPMEVAP